MQEPAAGGELPATPLVIGTPTRAYYVYEVKPTPEEETSKTAAETRLTESPVTDASFLDKKYTAFGKVLKGTDVLDKIANTPVERSGSGENSKPLTRVEVTSVKIVPADSVK